MSSVEQLDPAWLTDALRGSFPESAVVGVRSEAIGDGKIGSNHRLYLDWSGPGTAPATVVAKLPSSDPASRATGVGLGLYGREVGFYRELAARAACRTPACHVALTDSSTGDFVLLLEDLAPATAGDQLAGCSPRQAEAALDELALLHASHWDEPLPEFVPPGLAENAAEIQLLYSSLVDGFSDRYRGRLTPEVLDTVRRFGDEMVVWGTVAAAGPPALLHGDFRLDNLLFGNGRVAVVDWQVVATGSAAFDTAYFIGAGMLPGPRRLHELGLLHRYHARLTSTPETAAWTFDDCARAHRVSSLGGLIMAVIAAMMVGPGERSDEMFCVMAERHAEHAADCEAFDLLGPVTH